MESIFGLILSGAEMLLYVEVYYDMRSVRVCSFLDCKVFCTIFYGTAESLEQKCLCMFNFMSI